MTPDPRSTMCRSAARVARNVPFNVTSMTDDHCSSVMSDESGRATEAGVVHHDVDMTELGDRGGEQRLHVLLDRDVAQDDRRSLTGLLGQLISGLVQAPFVDVADHDPGAFLETLPRHGEPDARSCRRGDDDRLVLQQTVTRDVVGRIGCHQFATFGSGGRPSARSPMMLRWISFEPP